eukprot:tig00000792_g4218.t1
MTSSARSRRASARAASTAASRAGADYIRVPSFFAFPIPKEIRAEHAGPLLCGGATVYSPISEHCAPGTKVAILGIGGLGRAAPPARPWLRDVGDLEVGGQAGGGPQDGREGLALHHDQQQGPPPAQGDFSEPEADQFDVVLVTVSAALDWQPYLALLARRGNVRGGGARRRHGEHLGAAWQLLTKQTSVHGSIIAGRRLMGETLRFTATHKIQPLVELALYPFKEINEALQRAIDNKARYRVVFHMHGHHVH